MKFKMWLDTTLYSMRGTSGKRGMKPSGQFNGQRTIVEESTTLLPFLFQWLKERSKTTVKSYLKHGQITVNGRVTTQFDTSLNKGDVVILNYGRGKVEFNHPKIRVVWEDDSLIVIDKKDDIMAAGSNESKEPTVYRLLSDYMKRSDARSRLFLVNPLDRDTSGLMIFAKNKGVQDYFLSGWNHIIQERAFVAVVEGVPEEKNGLLTSLPKNSEENKVFVTSGRGGENIIRYQLVGTNDQYSLLELKQEAGKKVIIRTDLAAMGNPVAGDVRQGAQSDPIGRVAIHANKLSFIHPDTRETVAFQSHIPISFKTLVKK